MQTNSGEEMQKLVLFKPGHSPSMGCEPDQIEEQTYQSKIIQQI
jgi:hypothetical protein